MVMFMVPILMVIPITMPIVVITAAPVMIVIGFHYAAAQAD